MRLNPAFHPYNIWNTSGGPAMFDPVMKALFVTLGLILLCKLAALLPHASHPAPRA